MNCTTVIPVDMSDSLNVTRKESRPGAKFWLVSIPLAVALLYWSVRGIHWIRVWQSLADARLSYVGGCCVLITVNLLMRALRWRMLLLAEGHVPVVTAFW